MYIYLAAQCIERCIEEDLEHSRAAEAELMRMLDEAARGCDCGGR